MTGRLGIVDWGIGGLGVVRELRAEYMRKRTARPAISYLSDTGSAPYGTLGAKDLEARLRRAIGFLRERGASHVLLACNAASTALPHLSDLQHVTGVIEPTIALVAKRERGERIAIAGGRRTIVSRTYAKALTARGFEVTQKIAQPLSALIEAGEQKTPKFAAAVVHVLRGTSHCDALLLACTHYPAARAVFEDAFAGDVIDPLAAIARSVGKSLPKDAPARAADEFLTTGDSRAMQRAATLAWGASFASVKPRKVRLA